MSQPRLDPKLAALEKSLAALVPVPGQIDRDHLLFRAGQASVRPRHWFWPTMTAVLGIVACGLGTALALRPASATVERVVYLSVPQPAAASAPSPSPVFSGSSARRVSSTEEAENFWASSAGYLQQRNQVIRWGVDALPSAPSITSAGPAISVESLLGLPERKVDQAGLLRLKF